MGKIKAFYYEVLNELDIEDDFEEPDEVAEPEIHDNTEEE
jgi:hypothetical protein